MTSLGDPGSPVGSVGVGPASGRRAELQRADAAAATAQRGELAVTAAEAEAAASDEAAGDEGGHDFSKKCKMSLKVGGTCAQVFWIWIDR